MSLNHFPAGRHKGRSSKDDPKKRPRRQFESSAEVSVSITPNYEFTETKNIDHNIIIMAVSLTNNLLEEYKCDANLSIHFKLVKTEKDVFDKDSDFHPDMSHQVFGESEIIFGYKNLEVQLYYHAGSLLTYLGMKYDDVVDKSTSDGVEPDQVVSNIGKLLSPGYLRNLDQFISKIPEENEFTPMGELLYSYTDCENTYEVYKVDISTPNFRKYHEKLQTFALWYIDAASFIDVDDDKWDLFLMFEKCKEGGSTSYSFAGYMTVYCYYAYPDMKRPRISQFLILPPFQKKGLGAKLLEQVDTFYINDPKVLDMTGFMGEKSQRRTDSTIK